MKNDERFMRRCIKLARQAQQSGNTPVGSIVVRGDEIIGEGVEQMPAGGKLTGHAEALACQQAVECSGRLSLAGCLLYSTAEPCFMCSYVIRQAEVKEVRYGRNTPRIGGVTSKHPILTTTSLDDWKPIVTAVGGLLLPECDQLFT